MGKSFLKVSALLLSLACVVMAVITVVTSKKDQRLQLQLQQQVSALQSESQTISGTEQISRNILTDLGNTAISNAAIREMLSRHGYTLNTNTPPTAAGAIPTTASPMLAPIPAQEKNETLSPLTAEKSTPVSVTTPPVSAPADSAPAEKNADAKGDTKP